MEGGRREKERERERERVKEATQCNLLRFLNSLSSFIVVILLDKCR